MLIKVQFKNNEYGMVKPFLLDKLIASGKIIKFLRSDGWITIGVDRIRGTGNGNGNGNSGHYYGRERRKNSFLELMKWYREEFSEKVILRD